MGPGQTATAIGPQRGDATSSTLSTGVFTLCGRLSAYGRRVSGAMENRAAVFTSQPQAVEVYQAGAWWAGELLGWRHDANGSCQVWVRVVLGGVEETAWTDLASLRLPERHLAVATTGQTVRGAYGPGTQEMSIARHPSGRRARSADADGPATAGLPMVRDLSVVPGLPVPGGRRTADETAQFASVGRRRAPEDAPARPLPAVPPGRHRAADTGLPAAVSEPATSTARVAAGPAPGAPEVARPVVRPQQRAGRAGTGWTAPEGLEPELLTRPMRISDHVPHARRPRVDGSVRGV